VGALCQVLTLVCHGFYHPRAILDLLEELYFIKDN